MGRHGSSPLTISHFSHPHALHLTASVGPPCVACSLPAFAAGGGFSYSCHQCVFLLHLSCATLPLVVLHPCDAGHGLALLPRPPYSDGCFTCDACRRPGAGFAYHCSACVLDLHTLCAVAPEAVTNPAHPAHPLALAFRQPYGDGEGYTCDVCGGGGGTSEWLYRCATCEFDVHLSCGGGAAKTVPAYGGGVGAAAADAGRRREYVVKYWCRLWYRGLRRACWIALTEAERETEEEEWWI